MRIEWRTKWGLGGGHKCRATGALDEAGKSSLVSGGAEMWRNSISYHPALYIANCLFWKARKKNFQLFRALKPQPTSWVGWGTWLHKSQSHRGAADQRRKLESWTWIFSPCRLSYWQQNIPQCQGKQKHCIINTHQHASSNCQTVKLSDIACYIVWYSIVLTCIDTMEPLSSKAYALFSQVTLV